MALTKISRGLLDTGVSDSSDATAITIDSSENVGIGETSPLGKIHAKVSDTGASASAQGNLLVLEDTENGLSILSGTSAAGYINFGDSDDNDIGMIIYDHSANAMRFWTNAAERMRIDTSGLVGIGRTPSSSTGSMLQVEGNDGIAMRRPSQTNNFTLRPNASTDGMRFTQEGAGDRMFIDSSGHVGIGAAPSTTGFGGTYKYLGVQGGSGYGVFNGQTTSTSVNDGAVSFFGSTVGTSGFALLGGMQVINIASSASNAEGGLLFYTGSGGSIPERMRIDNSGNVLVGKTSVTDTVTGAEFRSSGRIGSTMNTNSATAESYILRSSSDNTYKFYVSLSGQIHATSTSITSLSDERLKENITDLETGLTEVMKLKPRRFDWKDKTDTNVAGFVAQEVETILPDLIGNYKHEELEDAKAVRMGDMIPTLVKAIQEQQEQIETLKAEVKELKDNG